MYLRLTFTFLLFLFSHFVLAQQSNAEYMEGEIYIKVKPAGVSEFSKLSPETDLALEIPSIYSRILESGAEVLEAKTPFFRDATGQIKYIYRVKVNPKGSIEGLLESLKKDPNILYAEPVMKREIISTPNDPQYSNQWFIDKVKAPQAWLVNAGIQDVVVAVVDNAIDTNHVDLKANMLPGFDVADNDSDPNPPNSTFNHGTHVAGIVGAVSNNSVGIASAGNNRVKILPIKATRNTSNNRFIDNGYEGITWAVDNGADIISLSWGGVGFSQTEQDVINYAYSQGVVVVAAAGNDNTNTSNYPASYEHVISVAALDTTDEKSSFSSYGLLVDIAAPGRGILSTLPFDTYGSFNGTSMATPLVSSCLAYLKACFPSLSPDSLEQVLKTTADDISAVNTAYPDQLGAGRVNLLKAVACKNSGLFDENIEVNPSLYFCEGDSVLLSVPVVATESFQWRLNGSILSSDASFFAKEAGEYILKREQGDCALLSPPIGLTFNTTFTSPPKTDNLYANYCEAVTFSATASNDIEKFGPKTFNYGGPEVGFDAFQVSGDLPSVQVENIAGLIDSVAISITWEKKDGGNYLSCDMPSGSGIPFNEEVMFQLRTPSGTLIDLVNTNTYGRGITSSGQVTTIFSPNGQEILKGDLPSSGNFKAKGDLGQLEDQVPVGTWTLLAQDNSFIDPLCVSGFNVTIKTKITTTEPTFRWFSSTFDTLATGPTYTKIAGEVGEGHYFVQSTLAGLCPSKLSLSKLFVEPTPRLFAFAEDEVLITRTQVAQIAQANIYFLELAPNGRYRIKGEDSNGIPFNYLLSNQSPRKSPLTVCNESNYVIFADGCDGTVSWSTGDTSPAVYVEQVSQNMTLWATCNKTWTCMPLSNIAFDLNTNTSKVEIKGIVGAFFEQDYDGEPIQSSQRILESSNVNYRSLKSVELKPGFETGNNVTFKAAIEACP